MGELRAELMDLIDPSDPNPSLTYLATILDFFLTNKDSINIPDLTILCAEVERCRAYACTTRRETITIFRNGKEENVERTVPGLDMPKDSIFPNPYDHLEMMREEREREELEAQRVKEERKMPTINDPMPAPVPLAAAPV